MMTEFQRGAMLPESHDFFRSARAPRVLGPEPRGRDFGPSHWVAPMAWDSFSRAFRQPGILPTQPSVKPH